jgi:hypothetical protein
MACRMRKVDRCSVVGQFRERHEPPFIGHVSRPGGKVLVGSRAGEVRMMLTYKQWLEKLAEEGDEP